MPTPSGPQFEQLKLFMTPAEVKDRVTTSGDLEPGETMDQMWDRKVEQSKAPRDTGHGSGVYDALSEGKPILDSVNVHFGTYMGEGKRSDTFIPNKHHRIAAQADIDATTGKETFVPIEYSGESGIPQPSQRPHIPPLHGPFPPPNTSRMAQIDRIMKFYL